MGLDMYLYRRTYVKRWSFKSEKDLFRVTVTRGGQPYPGIDSENVAYVIEQVGYWRKAHAIHQWFVDHVQDGKDNCREYRVNREQLESLLSICRRLVGFEPDKPVDEPIPECLLYADDLNVYRDTITILEACLNTGDASNGVDYSYQSSW